MIYTPLSLPRSANYVYDLLIIIHFMHEQRIETSLRFVKQRFLWNTILSFDFRLLVQAARRVHFNSAFWTRIVWVVSKHVDKDTRFVQELLEIFQTRIDGLTMKPNSQTDIGGLKGAPGEAPVMPEMSFFVSGFLKSIKLFVNVHWVDQQWLVVVNVGFLQQVFCVWHLPMSKHRHRHLSLLLPDYHKFW